MTWNLLYSDLSYLFLFFSKEIDNHGRVAVISFALPQSLLSLLRYCLSIGEDVFRRPTMDAKGFSFCDLKAQRWLSGGFVIFLFAGFPWRLQCV
ncbi:hypothetical protein VIGAN_01313200 [Vigna angularis var. angularis]|uniref:Uncharacterized protein n=1 Tax=Vigna angularis var. angularis TaxID=157739 RepID=A0A0S3R491_PHAAN|nr:hypothetical protein VIGAN_01313200 [Vigna angularis var. angularis]